MGDLDNQDAGFRQFMPDLGHPLMADVDKRTATSHVDFMCERVPFIRDWVAHLQQLYRAPFHGVTADGMTPGQIFG